MARLCPWSLLATVAVVASSARGQPPDLSVEPRCLDESALHVAVASRDARSVAAMVRQAPELRRSRNALGQTPLSLAAGLGDVAMVARLLRGAGDELELPDNAGATPLIRALWRGHDRVAMLLLRAGADILAARDDGVGALHAAARRGNVRMVRRMTRTLDSGEDEERLGRELERGDRAGLTPLDHAALSGSNQTLRELLRLGASAQPMTLAYLCGLSRVDLAGWLAPEVPWRGALPLDAAIESVLATRDGIKHVDPGAVSCLLDAGATPSTDALRLALDAGHADLAAQIMLRAAPRFDVDRGDPMLHVVARRGEVGLIQLLVLAGVPVDALDAEGATALQRAVMADSGLGVETMLDAGADPSLTFRGLGPRQLAIRHGALDALSELVEYVGHDLVSAAALDDLRAATAYLNAQPELATQADEDGLTPLHVAARFGSRPVTRLLLRRGADPNAAVGGGVRFESVDVSGWTALHFAAWGGHKRLYEWLLDQGVDDIPAADGLSAAARARFSLLAEEAPGGLAGGGWEVSGGWEVMPVPTIDKNWSLPPTESGKRRPRHHRAQARPSFTTLGGGVLREERRLEQEVLPLDILVDAELEGEAPRVASYLEECVASGHWFEAERLARALIDEHRLAPRPRILLGPDWRGRALLMSSALQTLGWVLTERLALGAAEKAFKSAEEEIGGPLSDRAEPDSQTLPEHHLWAAIAHGRARMRFRAGLYDHAAAELRHGLALMGDTLAPPALRAGILGTLIVALGRAARYSDAIAGAREGLAILEERGGESSHGPSVHVIRLNLGTLLARVGERVEARALAMEELARLQAGEVTDVEQGALIAYTAGLWRILDGAAADGEALMMAARDQLAEIHPRHPMLARFDLGIGLRSIKAGRYRAAARALARGEEALLTSEGAPAPEALSPAASIDYARILAAEASVARLESRLEDSLELGERAYAIIVGSEAPEAKWSTELELARIQADRGHLAVAIYFGKRAVATLEAIARAGVPEALREAFIEDRLEAWRELADNLVAAGRFLEATAALRAIKEEEVEALTTRDKRSEQTAEHPDAQQPQRRALPEIGRERQRGRPLRQLQSAQRKADEAVFEAAAGDPGAAATAKLERARQLLRERRRAFEAWLRSLEEDLEGMSPERVRAIAAMNLRDLSAMQRTLGKLGEGVVMVHYLITDDRLRAIITTPDGQTGRESAIHPRDLNTLVFQFREVLDDPNRNPRAVAQALHRALIEPIERDLDQAEARTLLVSLDGALRYVPIAALWDGTSWLIERYNVVSFARAALPRLLSPRAPTESLAAFGCGRPVPGFDELAAVPAELESIVKRDAEDPDGELPGVVLLDDAFSFASLAQVLEKQVHNAIHIASHFVLGPGGEDQSYLLLGDGSRLTLEDIRYDLRFDGVDLLSLSACNTAVGDRASDGREIEGFASLAMRLGARAVLATLWSVSDASTGLFMREVYRLMRAEPERSRAEVLRATMLSFIRGEVVAPVPAADRGARPLVAAASSPESVAVPASAAAPLSADPQPEENLDLTHPRYWAPFVLIGNWR